MSSKTQSASASQTIQAARKYRLQDLIDIPAFQAMQERMAAVYNIPSAIIDNDGIKLTATALQDVCARFHRQQEQCALECVKSDQYILGQLPSANPAFVYCCPHGLIDCALPIMIDGVHYGSFFAGQFFLEPPDLEFFRRQAQKFGFDEQMYLEAVQKVPVWSQQQLDNFIGFIQTLLEVISSSGLRALQAVEARIKVEETERREAERERQAMMEQFSLAQMEVSHARDILNAMLERVSDGFVAFDAEFNYTYVNEFGGALLGRAPGDLIGKNYWSEFPEARGTPFANAYVRAFETQQPVILEDYFSPWDRWFSNRIYPSQEGITIFFSDITERKRQEETLRRERKERENEINAISTLSAALRKAPTLKEMLPVIVQQIVSLINCDAVSIKMIDLQNGDYVVEAGHGPWQSSVGTRQRKGTGINAIIADTLQPYVTDDFAHDPNLAGSYWAESGIESCIGVPLIAQEQLIGFIWVGAASPILPGKVRLLSAISDIAASAIHRASLHEQTRRSAASLAKAYDTTLEGWAHALELRDQETEGHTRRVVERTIDLAKAMGIVNPQTLENMRRGALLHDIGKMGIPDSVLLKPGTLNEREWEIMRRHPEYAYTMLNQIEYLRPSLEIAYCHHEKWDGTGYPRGIKGEDIPLEARLFAIVDVWDALTSDRPYRKAWSQAEARRYIADQSGKHFDPRATEVFLAMMEG